MPPHPPARPTDRDPADPSSGPDAAVFERVQASPGFAGLRTTFRRFAFPMTGVFLAWYLLYVLLATYASSFMSTPVIGAVNVGLLLGLGQFASTFLITYLYVRHANRRVDPLAARLRAEVEGEVR